MSELTIDVNNKYIQLLLIVPSIIIFVICIVPILLVVLFLLIIEFCEYMFGKKRELI